MAIKVEPENTYFTPGISPNGGGHADAHNVFFFCYRNLFRSEINRLVVSSELKIKSKEKVITGPELVLFKLVKLIRPNPALCVTSFLQKR